MKAEEYLSIRRAVVDAGYGHEVEWSQELKSVTDSLIFWREFAWVILNSGMKNQVAERIWQKVRPEVESGGSAENVFGHKGKARAIDDIYSQRETTLEKYQAAEDKVAFCRSLPWIGPITCWHLAKTLGVDCAKPDRHLARIAGEEGVHAMCARLSEASGDRVATVDLVIWRSANLRMI